MREIDVACESLMPEGAISLLRVETVYREMNKNLHGPKTGSGQLVQQLKILFRDDWGPQYCDSVFVGEGEDVEECWYITPLAIELIKSAKRNYDLDRAGSSSVSMFFTPRRISDLQKVFSILGI